MADAHLRVHKDAAFPAPYLIQKGHGGAPARPETPSIFHQKEENRFCVRSPAAVPQGCGRGRCERAAAAEFAPLKRNKV